MTIDTLRLTAEGARDLLKAGEISGAELFAAYRGVTHPYYRFLRA